MKLRIESDGSRKHTKLIAEGGGVSEVVENVSKITWEFNEDDEFVTATIKVNEVGLSTQKDSAKDLL